MINILSNTIAIWAFFVGILVGIGIGQIIAIRKTMELIGGWFGK